MGNIRCVFKGGRLCIRLDFRRYRIGCFRVAADAAATVNEALAFEADLGAADEYDADCKSPAVLACATAAAADAAAAFAVLY